MTGTIFGLTISLVAKLKNINKGERWLDISKFNSKSLILPILEMIRNGLIISDIGKALKVAPPLVHYYITKAKKLGYISDGVRDAFKSYELTQAGKNFLDQYDNNSIPSLMCRAENIQFRAVIEKMPTIPVSWNKVQMNNWVQYNSKVDQVRVKINMGKVPNVEFLPSPVEGNDPFDIYVIMLVDVVNVVLELDRKFGLRVGRLQLGSRGEWLAYDPLARFSCKYSGQITYEGIAKVNASRPRSIGEFEFFDPRALYSYLLMPLRISEVDSRTERIETMLIKLLGNPEFVKSHKAAIIFANMIMSAYSRWIPLFIF